MARLSYALPALLAAGMAAAQTPGDPEAGRQLAEEYCAGCHDVEPGGAFKQNPPSFSAIAVYRGDEQVWSRIMFPIHTGMPEMWEFLEPENIEDITAYIRSLEAR